MHIAPEIRALITDPALLERAQARHGAALAAWQARPGGAAVLDAFAAFAGGADLARCPPLAALLGGQGGAAKAFVDRLVAALLPAIAAEPFGHVPLRHQSTPASATLLLAQERGATLTLVVVAGPALAKMPPARSVAFAPSEEWDVVLAGSGEGRLVERRADDSLVQHRLALAPGVALGRDVEREALLVDRVPGSLVLLRLARRRAGAVPVREYELAGGALIHQAASDPRESRMELAITLLGRMGRADAAPELAAIALEAGRGDSLRWQALRECLGLDTAVGFRALTVLARSAEDALAVPAGALRAQLLENYPVLAELEPCPA
ncbi:hypothetical protein ACFOD9_04765 [Novosphingobium bradum]|uniref:HEAT repeat domain-containing protein n=1 Tax=Novosphingobium bradum TaxID=1737444 RepID=A0ABV7IS72_9SPHN